MNFISLQHFSFCFISWYTLLAPLGAHGQGTSATAKRDPAATLAGQLSEAHWPGSKGGSSRACATVFAGDGIGDGTA